MCKVFLIFSVQLMCLMKLILFCLGILTFVNILNIDAISLELCEFNFLVSKISAKASECIS